MKILKNSNEYMDYTMKIIDTFRGLNGFLSNFWECPVMYDGVVYPSSEHAFQAAKTLDLNERETVRLCKTPGDAKRTGKLVSLRTDWEQVKIGVMYSILLYKFTNNPALRTKLKETGEAHLIEGNTWGDVFWGVCLDRGENHLGQLLMKIRSIL